MIKQLDKIDIDIVIDFRKTGESKAITPEMQAYILQIDKAAELLRVESNITRCSKRLINTPAGKNLTYRAAQARVYDAINYFYINNSVKNAAWDMYYADRLEDFARKCERIGLQERDGRLLKESRLALQCAHGYRTNKDENAIDPEDLIVKDQLLSPDITSDRLGLKQYDLNDLWKKGITLIKKFPITDKETKTITKEFAKAIDIDYEDLPD